MATNKNAVLFNPASPVLEEYDLDFINYDGDMTSYIVDGEIVSLTDGLMFPLPGNIRLVGDNSNMWNNIRKLYDQHIIDYIFKYSNFERLMFLNDIKKELDSAIGLHMPNSFFNSSSGENHD